MILTKEVEVKPSGKSFRYYKDLGYDVKYNQPLMVKIEDLQKGSKVKIEVLCDSCQNINKVSYDAYNRSVKNTGSYVCKTCVPQKRSQTIYEKYGEYNAAKVEMFKEKMKQTNLERYGVNNYGQTKECLDKRTKTMQEKYGVNHNSQLSDYKEKFHNTCVERYGESYYKYFVQKAFDSFCEKTGYSNPSQSPTVKETIRETCMQKYGVPYTLQVPEIREKVNETLCKNGTQKTSKQQLYLHSLYGGELNYPISYYAIDICFPEEKFVIEYDGGGHDLRVVLGQLTQEEFDQKEIIRNSVLKRKGYKQMRIISSKDKLPSDTTLLQMLNDAKEYFSNYPQHSWIEYNIDTSTLRNAEHKDGIYYSFGTLRTIKETDLNTAQAV